ncbi:MAG: CsgG/HfaB family protein, partial [bacterium]
GLADFTAQDLSKISSLQVVDRLKIDAVRRELELADSDLIDPATAPRIGRLVGGRRIVTGSLLALGDDRIRLNGAVVDAVDYSTGFPEQIDGDVVEFFRVQKDFVFHVVDELGITLTAEERTAIEEIPTESYLAFMAYCRGLGLRAEGRFGEAEAEFRRAAGADHGFSQAARASQSLSSRIAAGFTGGGADANRFAAAVGEVADAELLGEGLADIQISLLRIQAFVPLVGEVDLLGLPVDAPPRTGDLGQVEVLIHGNLDGGS